MKESLFTVRPATPEDDARIADLVVEGFLDKFRPIFGRRMEHSLRIMERWMRLEHRYGGVESLVAEGPEPDVISASVGVRVGDSDEATLTRGLWNALRGDLGYARALWAATLLSYPRYTAVPREAYVERLVVTKEHHRRGMARALLEGAEDLARERDKETVGLHVSGDNHPALRLYEAEGYEEVSRQRSLLTGYFLGTREWLYLRRGL